jgi:hypothetical protein
MNRKKESAEISNIGKFPTETTGSEGPNHFSIFSGTKEIVHSKKARVTTDSVCLIQKSMSTRISLVVRPRQFALDEIVKLADTELYQYARKR